MDGKNSNSKWYYKNLWLFDENSKLKSGISEDYDNIKESISRNKEETKHKAFINL